MISRSRVLAAATLLAILATPSRLYAQASLTISDLYASSPDPLIAGRPVAWTAVASSTEIVEYRFYMYKRTHWVLVRDWDLDLKFTWTPSDDDQGGPYYLQVWARILGSTAPYEAWRGTGAFWVTVTPIELIASVDFPTPPHNQITWTARMPDSSAAPYEYKFWVLDQIAGTRSVLREYASDNQVDWTPPLAGTYAVEVWARQLGSTAEYHLSTTTDLFEVAPSEIGLTGIFTDSVQPLTTGAPVTWTARPIGGTTGPLLYQFVVGAGGGTSKAMQTYDPRHTFTWTPTWNDAGEYYLTATLIDFRALPAPGEWWWGPGPYFWYGPRKMSVLKT